MSKLTPVNDHFMIEVMGKQENPMGLVGIQSADEGIRFGRITQISDFLTFFGFNTFSFDSSLMQEDLLKSIHGKYKEFVGKRVFWPERSESGTAIKYDGKEYVFLKWSAIMAVEEE